MFHSGIKDPSLNISIFLTGVVICKVNQKKLNLDVCDVFNATCYANLKSTHPDIYYLVSRLQSNYFRPDAQRHSGQSPGIGSICRNSGFGLW